MRSSPFEKLSTPTALSLRLKVAVARNIMVAEVIAESNKVREIQDIGIDETGRPQVSLSAKEMASSLNKRINQKCLFQITEM